MPEGDILKRTARSLDRALTGSVLVRAELRWPSAASVDLTGTTVIGTESYGKHVFTRFDDGRSLHTHLRMDGSWQIARTGSAGSSARGPFVRAVLASTDWTAVGDRLGMLDVVATRDEHTLIAHLGPDVLGDAFPTAGLPVALERFADRGSTPVAEVLLDQTVVAGLGTIYMAESLFVRRLWPWTAGRDVADPASLLMTARVLMERSVVAQHPTATGDDRRGLTTWVHGRLRQPCRRCGTPVAVGQARAAPMQRPVFYCPGCQGPARVSRRA
ncbi:DNA-formamidopyrimidine glycosylase family protein [Cellulomonas sp. KRMCY2]|uniref:DNA-formamidopyrimidine glycosylase family protein n=1 Tax=Cellulomonas sp. KRMCY2 TaxID=1304865 RepID=UPI00045E626B|nr:DNA-formamidopyrimidine glycosylase family protein [Cellulomonas sp. KRMCY2]